MRARHRRSARGARRLTDKTAACRQAWEGVPDARRAVMRANKAKDTKPEVAVRRMLHAIGYRFRLHRRDLPGTPDIVFPSRRKAIQVHGCFWHQHEGCRRANVPAARPEYWGPKLARNKKRDREVQARLEALGWEVLTVWECEVADIHAVTERAVAFLGLATSSALPITLSRLRPTA